MLFKSPRDQEAIMARIADKVGAGNARPLRITDQWRHQFIASVEKGDGFEEQAAFSILVGGEATYGS